MIYIVLYEEDIDLGHRHFLPDCRDGNYTDYALYDTKTTRFQAFTNKKEAIEFAKANNGEIIEGFEFDINKGGKS